MSKTKCKCGNEQGRPQVNPVGKVLFNLVTKEHEPLYYQAGNFRDGTCWYCQFPRA